MKGMVLYMKKILCLILVICFVFLPVNQIYLTDENSNNFASNLLSTSELMLILANENIDVECADAYDICALIRFEETISDDSLVFDESSIVDYDNDVDAALKAHRKNVKAHYVAFNEKNAASLGLDDYDYCISYYSPYIEIVFDDIDEYSSNREKLLASAMSSDAVLSIGSYAVYDDIYVEATIDSSTYSTIYPIDQAFADIGVLDSVFTGDGVVVGVWDAGIPTSTVNMKPGHYTMVDTDTHVHSTVVTSILGGTSGVAEDVHFVCFLSEDRGFADINLLIDTYNVNAINMSLGYGFGGYYTECDASIDNIVANTGCTFVKSAGNRGDADAIITAPGCAMNAITVGAVNFSHNLSYKSSYVADDYLMKPDVVAPCGRFSGIPNLSTTSSGTSYAAPMVTGTIALLMEEFPILKTNPAMVKSVLHLGAEKLPSQTSYFDQQAGFGLINYQNMRNCLLNSNYHNFIVSNTASDGDVILSRPVTLNYLDEIYINANSIINSSVTSISRVEATPAYTDYSIKIYDVAAAKYVAESTIDSNVDYLLFTNSVRTKSSFRIDIVLEEDSASNGTEKGAIAYEIISAHSFGAYIYYNNSSHRKSCFCGFYISEGHSVRQADIVNNRYARCLGCRAQLDLSVDNANIIMSNITQVSINGSYILSNGIVVLVDEDIQAYMDGTLVFYHPDDIPVTQ